MKLSIITINKDNLKGLKKTICSVFGQVWKDYEYIIIDGASTDGSVDYIKSISDKLVYWISEPDTGVYQAMNKGILQAKGEYLLFLNSGDFLVNREVVFDVFSNQCCEDILCGRCYVSNKNKVVWTSNPPEYVTFGTLYNEGLAHQSTFIRLDLFKQYGLYREDFKYNSDIEFWYRTIIENNATTKKINVVVTDYNLDGISSTECKSDQYRKEMQEILNPYCRFLPDYDLWKNEQKSMIIFYWIKRHTFLMSLLVLLYKFTKKVNKN